MTDAELNNYIVLSPPCDLAIHEGVMKTDCILVCEIENHDEIIKAGIRETSNKSKKIKKITKAIKNNNKEYLHWLPANEIFEGGFINFRKAHTFSIKEFKEKFPDPEIKIQDYFVKNILNRFSNYYSRQGQPDFAYDKEAGLIMSVFAEQEK